MTRLLLVAAALVAVIAAAGVGAGATTWVVDDDGGAGVDYMTIQAAVNAADAGDTIEVRSGTYVENVNADKRLTLIGEGVDVVTVQAALMQTHALTADVSGGADYLSLYMGVGA